MQKAASPETKTDTANTFFLLPEKAEFKILQVTDMHFDVIGIGSLKHRIINDIRQMCDHFQVDLIVNTGDLFCRSPPIFIKHILRQFDSIGYPWAFAWGNHDCENFSKGHWFETFDELEAYLAQLPNCLYKQTRRFMEQYGGDDIAANPREKEAYQDKIENAMKNDPAYRGSKRKAPERRFDGFYGGNYRIQIVNPATKVAAWELYILNSRRDYHIPPKVLRWMGNSINVNAPRVPAMAFYHVPNFEFERLWKEGKALGIKGERVCFEKDDGAIHNVFKTFGTLRGCFVGHDHVNDYYVEQDGIRYSYGRKTGVYAYGARYGMKYHYIHGQKYITPGATLITLKFDSADPLQNSWTQCSVFPDGKTWVPSRMEDMGTIK